MVNDRLKVGAITTTHGIRGEVKVYPMTDDMGRFKKLKKVFLNTGKEDIELEVEGAKFFKDMVILKFKGIDNINDVEKYKGKELFVDRKDAVKLNKDEYFIADLIGMKASSDDHTIEGEVFDVLSTGANDVYVIHYGDDKEILLPAIKDCILNIDIEKNEMLFHVMDGLL